MRWFVKLLVLFNSMIFLAISVVYIKAGFYIAGVALMVSAFTSMGTALTDENTPVVADMLIDVLFLATAPFTIVTIVLFIVDIVPDIYLLATKKEHI